jgi:hypothetical protein
MSYMSYEIERNVYRMLYGKGTRLGNGDLSVVESS